MNSPTRALLAQWAAIIAVVGTLAAIPTSWIERGPALCLISAVLGACPVCGSVRAISHFLHGHLHEAVQSNINVVVTGPLLLCLAADALMRLAQHASRLRTKSHNRPAT